MLRWLSLWFAMCIIICCSPLSVFAQETEPAVEEEPPGETVTPPPPPRQLTYECVEWSAKPFEYQGMLMAPVADVFTWVGAAGYADQGGKLWRAEGYGKRVQLTLKSGEKVVMVNGEKALLPCPLVQRDDRYFIPLRWVADLFGASLDTARIPRAIVISTEDSRRLLPLAFTPYSRIGLCCWRDGELRGRSLNAASILGRVRQTLKARLKAQGITAVEVPSFEAARKKGLPLTLVAAYAEENSGTYQLSGHEGTDVSLTLTLRDGQGEYIDWEDSIYGYTPTSLLVSSLSEVRSRARRMAIDELYGELSRWQPAPPVKDCWWHEYWEKL